MPPVNMQRPDNVEESDWQDLQSQLGQFSHSSNPTPQQLMNATPEQLGNDPQMEMEWAMKAGKHAETYMKMLHIYRHNLPKLKLTSIDDELYSDFRSTFPDLNVKDLPEITRGASMTTWQNFVKRYEKRTDVIKDPTFGTLLRRTATDSYNPDNVTIVVRVIFLAIELCRNRENVNQHVAQLDPAVEEQKLADRKEQ